MRILQVVDSLNEGTGGTSYSVSEMADALAGSDIPVRLLSQNYPALGPIVHPFHAQTRIVRATQLPFRLGSISPIFFRALKEEAQWASLIHSNGMWLPTNRMTRNAAIRHKKPLVISTRGMFESWSLRHKALRKRLAWWLMESANLRSTACLHATSDQEADTLRAQLRLPVAVIPNGVKIPDNLTPINRAILEKKFPVLTGKRWLLFLSRLHPKKGLMELLRTWKTVAPDFPKWHLLIAGGDESNYRRELERFAKSSGITDRVTFPGNLSGEFKACAFANAEVFILPSHSENFGRVVAEALSYGVPVITTRQTPWSLLEEKDCGWWIDDTEPALEEALRHALSLHRDSLRSMGQRGREMVAQHFSWKSVASQLTALYRWILKMDADPPKSVRMP